MFNVTIVKRFNLPLYSFLVAMRVDTSVADPKIFVVRRVPELASSVSLSSSGSSQSSNSLSTSSSSISSSSMASMSPSSSSASSASSSMEPSSSESMFPDLFPESCDLELVSIASLGDLQQLPDTPQSSGLYRTDLIALAFKTRAQMDNTVDSIIKDIRTNALFQKIPLTSFEVIPFVETIPGDPTPDDDFIF